MSRSDRLVWIDLEMTGLDPDRERIIEIATIVTDPDLNVVAEGPEFAVYQEEPVLTAMDDWNQRQHGHSGLLQRVRGSDVDARQAEERTLAFLGEHCIEGTAPLCGNSVHHDRRFLRRYMPRLDAFLHYRIVDVSTVKELVERWYPEVAVRAPSKAESHRAMGDIRESIEELRYYREAVFRGQ